MRFVSTRAAAAGALVFAAMALGAPVFAMGDWPPATETGGGNVTQVPEIDAGAGVAALAAVGAALAFAWERRRR